MWQGKAGPLPPACVGTLRLAISFQGYSIMQAGDRMDDAKVFLVSEWPKPQSFKDMLQFLGFTNLYCRFIQSFSLMPASLPNLLKGKPKNLTRKAEHNNDIGNCKLLAFKAELEEWQH